MVNRRSLLQVTALGSLIAPLHAAAQRPERVARIAFIDDHVPLPWLQGSQPTCEFLGALIAGLRDLGHLEGKNIVIERRSAEGQPGRIPALVREMIDLGVDVLVTNTGAITDAARLATERIPIVMISEGDPVAMGWVKSLSHPGGNLTGLSSGVGTALDGKRLQFIKEILPRAARVGIIRPGGGIDTANWAPVVEAAARTLGLTLQWFSLDSPSAIGKVLAAISSARPDAILATDTLLARAVSGRIVDFGILEKIATVCPRRWWVEGGALLSYGPDALDLTRRAAIYVDKILNGVKPADIPIEQPTRFELVINMKTARAIGVVIPRTLVLRADALIQ